MLYKKIFIISILIFLSPISTYSNIISIDDKKRINTIVHKISRKSEYGSQRKIEISNRIIISLKQYAEEEKKHRELIYHIINKFEILIDENIKQNTIVGGIVTGKVYNYNVINKEFEVLGKPYFIIRSFFQNDIKKYLILDGTNFTTSIILSENIYKFSEYGDIYEKSEYKKHQQSITKQEIKDIHSHENYGLKKSTNPHDKNKYITTDLCPSSKLGFEKDLFIKFKEEGNINIGIAITQGWIEGHPDSFKWLIKKQVNKELNITWINHTKTHFYTKGIPYKNNFILYKGTNLEDEIISVEKTLIENGQTPSIFMRFPGLVSNEDIRKSVVNKYGLIPLGSNAWLSKGEYPKAGSIILIHGNKNEPDGVKKIKKYIKSNPESTFESINNILINK